MEVATLEDAEPIFELALACEDLYAEQIAKLEGDIESNDGVMLTEFSERFAAWAAFLGVFAHPKICLDRKLRHHVSIQAQVLGLLRIMETNLAFSIASTPRSLSITNSVSLRIGRTSRTEGN